MLKVLIFRFFKALSLFQTKFIGYRLMNVYQNITKRPTRFFYDESTGLYFAIEQNIPAYFNVWLRGVNLYSNGLINRGQTLLESYCSEDIDFNEGDIIIDCGANFGDLSLAFIDNLEFLTYIMIEPSPEEFRCLLAAQRCAQLYNIALADEEGEMNFYISSAGGDSSLIEPASKSEAVIKVKTSKLDNFVARNKIGQIKLLKLEAEGFEPEILMGGAHTLSKIEYIAIDGGPERGVNSEETLSFAINYLCSRNFVIEKINISGANGRALFRNKDFKS
jgi:FkbM family methyltransferase